MRQTLDFCLCLGSSDLGIYGSNCVGCPVNQTLYSPSHNAKLVSCVVRDMHSHYCLHHNQPKKKINKPPCKICWSNNQCGFADHYADGSFMEGMVYQDLLQFGEYSQYCTLGAILNVSAYFEASGVSGILGCGMKLRHRYFFFRELTQFSQNESIPFSELIRRLARI